MVREAVKNYSKVIAYLIIGLIIVFYTSASVSAVNFLTEKKASFRTNAPNNDFWIQSPLEALEKAKSTERIIVKFKENTDQLAKDEFKAEYGFTETANVDEDTIVLDASNAGNKFSDPQNLENESIVEYAEKDEKLVAFAQVTTYGFDQIFADNAHTTNSATGTGTVIAVLDTGIDYNHEDLSSNIWANSAETAGNGVDDDGNGFTDDVRGWDFAGAAVGASAQDNDPIDEFGHGTHVSGIASAQDNSLGTIGVAPDAEIMPVKVLDDYGYGSNSTIASGIYYAVDNGADVINMSLGGSVPSSAIREAVEYAEANGVVVVAAAGNSYGFNMFSSYPASYPSVISVSATGEDGLRAVWSNLGKVEVAAPGDEIMSSVLDSRYAKYSGTSMASPFVAGAMALAVQEHPSYSPKQLRHLLASTSSDIFETGNDFQSGNGFLNAEQLTSVPTAGLSGSSSTWRIIADNNIFTEGQADIVATILDTNGDPVVGETVSFTTNKGSLSTPSDVTDVNGDASVTLTANDTEGSAVVTMSNGTYGSSVANILLYNDKVYVADISLFKHADLLEETLTGYFTAGQTIDVYASLRSLQLTYFDTFSTRTADISYTVLDSSSNPVAGLSGGANDVVVGSVGFFGSSPYGQANFDLELPENLSDGTYTMEITATDEESAKIDTSTIQFNVGTSGDILVIPQNRFRIDVHDMDYGSTSPASQLELTSTLESMAVSYDVWPYSYPPDDYSPNNLTSYSTIVLTDANRDAKNVAGNYLEQGGNVFINGNTDFATHLFSSYDSAYSTGWCGTTPYSDSDLGFSCAGKKVSPSVISGQAGSFFDGESYDINAYNFNSDGTLDQLVADEIVAGTGATQELAFSSGINSPAVTGISRDNGNSRLLVTGFGVNGVNDNGINSRQDFLDSVFEFLRPSAGMSLTDIDQGSVYAGSGGLVTINGNGFERTGTTDVNFGGVPATSVTVVDRNTITARVQSGLTVGTHDVEVVSPFGQSETLVGALVVTKKAPVITSFSPNSGDNNLTRTVTINGKYFQPGARVKIGPTLISISNTNFISSTRVTAKIPKNYPEGSYYLRVINPDTQRVRSSNMYQVK